MSKDKNRYGKYSEHKLKRDKRTIPMFGCKEDTNKYFRCWNCNFVCDKDRDVIEQGDYGTGGVVPTAFTDTDGTTSYYPLVTKGCPSCGSTNYR